MPQPVSARLPAAELQAIIALADPPVVLADQVLAVDRPVCDVPTLLGESGDDSPLPVQISPSWKARRHLADQLARYKHPSSFEIVAAPLRDDAGKVRRSQLRADRIAPATGGSVTRTTSG